jgi:outer membrane biosynthesis protein TonB
VATAAKQALPPPAPPHFSEQDFSTGLRWSVGVHILLFAFIIVKSLVFPEKFIPIMPTLRVDIVGLPDQIKGERFHMPPPASGGTKKEEIPAPKVPEPKAVPKPPAKAVERAAPDEMVYKPKSSQPEAKESAKESAKEREKELKSALARIKALSKISADSDDEGPAAPALIKGNRISHGTSLSGEAREGAGVTYYETVRDHLQQNWALPVWIARQKLSAQVQIFVDGGGRLRSFKFIKFSGNGQFDDAVKNTVTTSQPYPTPPQQLVSSLLANGILVGFPL